MNVGCEFQEEGSWLDEADHKADLFFLSTKAWLKLYNWLEVYACMYTKRHQTFNKEIQDRIQTRQRH